jgi:hypothetical protein
LDEKPVTNRVLRFDDEDDMNATKDEKKFVGIPAELVTHMDLS